jgi:hypothetical protein
MIVGSTKEGIGPLGTGGESKRMRDTNGLESRRKITS